MSVVGSLLSGRRVGERWKTTAVTEIDYGFKHIREAAGPGSKCYWDKKKIDKLKTISKFNMGERRDYLGS